MNNLLVTCATAAALLGASAMSFAGTKEENRDVDSFSSVNLRGFMDVTIEVGERQSVRVKADDDIIDNVITEVRGDTLFLDMEKGRYRNVDKLHIYITVPELSSADLSGSGDMIISGLNNQDFDFSLRGSGDAELSGGTLLKVGLSLRGSGDIEVEGRCKDVNVRLQGSGDIMADDLKCSAASVDLRGSGDVEIYADQEVSVELRGSGNVDIYGDPTRVNSKVRGSGEVSVN